MAHSIGYVKMYSTSNVLCTILYPTKSSDVCFIFHQAYCNLIVEVIKIAQIFWFCFWDEIVVTVLIMCGTHKKTSWVSDKNIGLIIPACRLLLRLIFALNLRTNSRSWSTYRLRGVNYPKKTAKDFSLQTRPVNCNSIANMIHIISYNSA